MKEVDLQRMIIDAVRAHSGAAHKLSNRFLVGVSDLLVKLPDLPAALLEVKLNKFSAKTPLSQPYIPDVTMLQDRFMREYWGAGMACGVYSFVEHGNGIRAVRSRMISFGEFRIGRAYRVGDSGLLGASERARFTSIVDDIRNLCNG